MMGQQPREECLFYSFRLEDQIPETHLLRLIDRYVDFSFVRDRLQPFYSPTGRPSIDPEVLLRLLLVGYLYGISSERRLLEEVRMHLAYRWFTRLGLDQEAPDHSTFSKNRDRLLEGEIAAKFLAAVLAQPKVKRLLSSDHFSVDGTLIEAWASIKSFRRKDGSDDDSQGPGRNAERSFHKEKRSNETHQSTTDPDARLYKKGDGQPAKLCYMGHALMENRNGLLIDLLVSQATGSSEREAAQHMIKRQRGKGVKVKSLGADKGYDTRDFVGFLRGRKIVPHVAANTQRRGGSAIDGRTTRHESYSLSQRIRKRVEEIFGWIKTVGGFRKTRFRGTQRTQLAAWWVGAAYNLWRMAKLAA